MLHKLACFHIPSSHQSRRYWLISQVLLFVSLAAYLLRVKNVAGLAVVEGETGKMRAAADCEGCSILDELGERTCGGEVMSLGCSQW